MAVIFAFIAVLALVLEANNVKLVDGRPVTVCNKNIAQRI